MIECDLVCDSGLHNSCNVVQLNDAAANKRVVKHHQINAIAIGGVKVSSNLYIFSNVGAK